MNVPAIRAALERLDWPPLADPIMTDERVCAAVVRVGLRACAEWDTDLSEVWRGEVYKELEVIADILREAGVEVEA